MTITVSFQCPICQGEWGKFELEVVDPDDQQDPGFWKEAIEGAALRVHHHQNPKCRGDEILVKLSKEDGQRLLTAFARGTVQ